MNLLSNITDALLKVSNPWPHQEALRVNLVSHRAVQRLLVQRLLGSSIKYLVKMSVLSEENKPYLCESFEVIFGKGGQDTVAFSFGTLLFSTWRYHIINPTKKTS